MALAAPKVRVPISDCTGTHQSPVKYLGQDYEVLKAQCLENRTLFEDETFPAIPSSVGFNELGPTAANTKGLVWLRPKDIKPNPQFIVDGATRVDVNQGFVGDCWLLASIASLTLNEDFLYLVVPRNQSFETDYAGIFHFKFWQYGEWVDVVVDDRLPTKKRKLAFVKSTEENEFWTALLEKAYAKLNGSYEALIGGVPCEALQDFTGGIIELYTLKDAPNDFFQIVQQALETKALLTCCTMPDEKEKEKVTSNNLVKGHAYTLVGAEEVSYADRKEKLVRVRNPWGRVEWNGPWSDNCSEWDKVDPKVKANLNKQCDDGEAWMSFSHFVNEYYRVEICNVSLESGCPDERHMWCVTQFDGSWKSGINAGGCPKYKETYWTNPQFRFRLEEPGHGCCRPADEPYCNVIVGLLQKNRRKRKSTGKHMLHIGFFMYQVPKEFENCPGFQMSKDFFRTTKRVARTDVYKDQRETSKRLKLPVGEYLIVPHTFDPGEDGDFCLRIFSEKNTGSVFSITSSYVRNSPPLLSVRDSQKVGRNKSPTPPDSSSRESQGTASPKPKQDERPHSPLPKIQNDNAS
ncbi:calpain-8-like [Discoglossus pictus]